jgi:hypothetical protein
VIGDGLLLLSSHVTCSKAPPISAETTMTTVLQIAVAKVTKPTVSLCVASGRTLRRRSDELDKYCTGTPSVDPGKQT